MEIYKKYLDNNSGNTIKIFYDELPENPFIDLNDPIKFYFCHRNYEISEKDYNFTSYDDLIIKMINDILPGIYNKFKFVEDCYNGIINDKLFDYFNKFAYILPVYMYDHSGITINTIPFSCKFDSGKVGYIVLLKKHLKDYSKTLPKKALEKSEKACKILKDYITCIDDYITGNCYGFHVENSDGEIIDSCYGFLGDCSTNGIFEHIGVQEKNLQEI